MTPRAGETLWLTLDNRKGRHGPLFPNMIGAPKNRDNKRAAGQPPPPQTTTAANHHSRKPPPPPTTTAAKRWRGAVARLGVMTTKTEDREGRGAAGAYKKTSYYHFRLSSLFCVTFDITCIVTALFVLIYSKTLARVRAAAAVRQAASLHPPSPFSRIDSTHSRNSTRALRLCVEFTCNCTRFGMHGACIVL